MRIVTPLLALSITASLPACDSAEMRGGTAIGNGSGTLSGTNNNLNPSGKSDTPSEADDSAISTFAPEPDAATLPTAISGASLLCLPVLGNMECSVYDQTHALIDYPVTRAFIISGTPAVWTETTFTPSEKGKWTVVVPPMITGNYGVALNGAQSQVIADLHTSDELPVNLVADPSFESYTSTVADGSIFSPGAASTIWVGRVGPRTACTIPIIEVQRTRAAVSAFDGNNFVELNSMCTDNPRKTNDPNATILTQELNLLAGHFYEITFAVARAPERTTASRVVVRLSGTLAVDTLVPDTAWTEQKMIVQANGTNNRLEFEELLVDKTAIGTLLDNVRVYDLGADPATSAP